MNRIKKLIIAVLTLCVAVCVSVGVAACADKNPDYKNPADGSIGPALDDVNASNKYTVSVKSQGGLPLTGVRVNFKKDGNTVVSGISNNGEIVVYTDPADYTLEVEEETLPRGYYLPEGFSCNTGDKKTATVYLSSEIIPTEAEAGTVYAKGNVMHNFSFVDTDDNTHTLLELMDGKKAVMINFFFITCGPCQSEFPAIQEAYEAYSDEVSLVALTRDPSDTYTAIRNFRTSRGYTFYFGRDEAGLNSYFSVNGYPTTIIIDRYGAIAYWDSGYEPNANVWKSLFSRFVSDNYTQDISSEDESGDGNEEVKDIIKPFDVSEPDYNLLASQIGANAAGKISFHPETNEKDAPNTWPWVMENDSEYVYMSASNATQDPSFAIIYCELNLKSGDIVSYDYSINSSNRYDYLYVIIDGRTVVAQHTGDSGGWTTNSEIYTANRDVTISLSFTYMKNYSSSKVAVDNEFARIKNISVVNVSELSEAKDIARSFYYEGLTPDNIELGADGYYHITGTDTEHDGAILYAELWDDTPWSFIHTGAYTFIPEKEVASYYASLHYLSFYEISTPSTETTPSRYTYLTDSEVEYINPVLDIQKFSDNGLMPVTETLKTIMIKFCEAFNETSVHCITECDEDSWLEMCFFFQHYNGKHIETIYDEEGNAIGTQEGKCARHDDPIEAMTYFNAYKAELSTANEKKWNPVKVTKSNTTYGGGGIFYEFTTEKSGVYKFSTRWTEGDSATDPVINLYSKDGDGIKFLTMETVDNSYDALARNNGDVANRPYNNPVIYYYFEAGETVYIQLHNYARGTECEFDFTVECVGDSYEWLRVCTVAEGAFIADVDEEGNMIGASTYGTIPWAYNSGDDRYYSYENYEFGSKIYIDFIHDNYLRIDDEDLKYRPLKNMLDAGLFDLTDKYHDNHTERMTYYYNESIKGKEETDELYGMVEASWELVQMVSEMISDRFSEQDKYDSGYWLSVACYYEHIGK